MNNKDCIFSNTVPFAFNNILICLPCHTSSQEYNYEMLEELHPQVQATCAPTWLGAHTMETLTKEGRRERLPELIWEKVGKAVYYDSLALYPELIITWLNRQSSGSHVWHSWQQHFLIFTVSHVSSILCPFLCLWPPPSSLMDWLLAGLFPALNTAVLWEA